MSYLNLAGEGLPHIGPEGLRIRLSIIGPCRKGSGMGLLPFHQVLLAPANAVATKVEGGREGPVVDPTIDRGPAEAGLMFHFASTQKTIEHIRCFREPVNIAGRLRKRGRLACPRIPL
jgi:hypothetical protein